MKMKKILSLLFLGVLTLGIGCKTACDATSKDTVDIPVLKAAETIAATATGDVYVTAEGLGLPGRSYAHSEYSMSGLTFYFDHVRKYHHGRIELRGTGDGPGIIYNTIATPVKIDSVCLIFSELHLNDLTEPDGTNVFASTTTNTEEKLITPTKNGLVYTYDFKDVTAYNFLKIKSTSTSLTDINMIIVRLANDARDEAENLAKQINTKLDGYCGIKAVDQTVWNEIGGLINTASLEAKKAFTDCVLNQLPEDTKEHNQGTEIQHFVERHDYIVAKYGYDNLLGRSIAPAISEAISPINNTNSIIILTIGLLSTSFLITFIVFQSKRRTKHN